MLSPYSSFNYSLIKKNLHFLYRIFQYITPDMIAPFSARFPTPLIKTKQYSMTMFFSSILSCGGCSGYVPSRYFFLSSRLLSKQKCQARCWSISFQLTSDSSDMVPNVIPKLNQFFWFSLYFSYIIVNCILSLIPSFPPVRPRPQPPPDKNRHSLIHPF